jgi:hypothetical protein
MNATTNNAWTPEGAIRTAIRRMKNHGMEEAAIYSTLQLVATGRMPATGNLKGAIKRCVKHGLDNAAIVTAILTVVARHYASTELPAPVATPSVQPAAKVAKASVKRERTPEQVAADKAKMARVRSFRKDAVEARKAPEPAHHEVTKRVSAPVVLKSFNQLDQLLTELGF